MVYAAEIDDGTAITKKRRLTLRVSGMLWKRSLVMEDVETGSLWSHILGECMRGKLKGEVLESIPSEMVTWKSWRTRHPESTVLALPRTVENYTKDFYRAGLQKFLLGVVIKGQAHAYSFRLLDARLVVQDSVAEQAILATYDPDSTRATVFSRRLDEKTLTFELLPATDSGEKRFLRDKSGSTWDPASGRAISGPLKGKRLKVLPGIVSFTKAWKEFHPESTFAKGL